MFSKQVHEALEQYDVLVTPTSSLAAQPIVEDPIRTSKEDAKPMPYLQTRTFNLASAPAVSIPCGLSDEGLPIGLQIGGRPGADQTVLNVPRLRAGTIAPPAPAHVVRSRAQFRRCEAQADAAVKRSPYESQSLSSGKGLG